MLHRLAFVASVVLFLAGCGGTTSTTSTTLSAALPPGVLFDHAGELGDDDRPVGGGILADRFEVQVPAGARLTVEVTTSAFDPVLDVSAPGANAVSNDDWEGDRTRSRIELVAQTAGVLKVQVSSYAAGATGAYHVTVKTDDLGASLVVPTQDAVPTQVPVPTPTDGQPVVVTPGQIAQGAIETTDTRAFDGSFSDTVRVESTEHAPLTIRVSSPSGDRLRALCMDAAGHAVTQQSNGVFVLEGGAPITLQILAAAPGQTAHWAVGVDQTAPVQPVPTPVHPSGTNHAVPATPPANLTVIQLGTPATGTLAAGDLLLSEQEFADAFAFDAQAGTRLRVELASPALDTYLIVIAPDGTRQEDDDGAASGRDSLLTFDVPTAGRYIVYATSYAANETGAYTLSAAQRAAPAPPNNQHQTIRGQLKNSDRRRPSGELADTYLFNLTAGTTVRFEATSAAFDTYLIVASPLGTMVENDDGGGGTTAAIDYEVQTTGPHRVTVSAYRTGMLGNYVLQVDGASRGVRTQGGITGPPPPPPAMP